MAATTSGALLGDGYALPEEERPARERESYDAFLARLSHQSVMKHFDAYADIDWDADEFRVDPEDPIWERPADDPLGATAWYRAQPQPVRARLSLHLIASQMKIGIEFERVLKQGLLEFAGTLPSGAPEFRYAYHEVIEEAQHSLMFQEFVNRTGLPVRGLSRLDRLGGRHVVTLGKRFPALFFLFVLGGEDPIDHAQRQVLRSGETLHPLIKRIMQIHVTEEARHVAFARQYLREHVPALGRPARAWLAVRAPIILALMTRAMMRPPADVVRAYGMPRAVVAEAYTRSPIHRAFVLESLAKVRGLCAELGLVTRRSVGLWRRLGIWDGAAPA